MTKAVAYTKGRFFDGARFVDAAFAQVENGIFAGFSDAPPKGAEVIDLCGDILCPPFVDLQVNGGGGVNFNDNPSPKTLARITAAHKATGTGALMATLITDTPEKTAAAVDAVATCGLPEIVGLHLEGPHIAPEKKGAHDAGLIRPLGEADLAVLIDAARRVPRLVVTLAPEAASHDAIAALSAAGVVVSLGHSAACFADAQAAFDAGATMATHLFNAMGPLNHRAPGLAGAALSNGAVSVGLIADGLHVHPALLGPMIRGKTPPGEVFLVTDAMAPFGTDLDGFDLGGRRVARVGNRLTLEDGTLAGANTDLLSAIRLLVGEADVPLATALSMATHRPAVAAKLPARVGRLRAGGPAPIRISADLRNLVPLLA